MAGISLIILFMSLARTALAAKEADRSNYLGYKPNTGVTGAATCCYAGAASIMLFLLVRGRWPARYMLSMIIGAYSQFTAKFVTSRRLMPLLVMAGGLALRFMLRTHPGNLKLYAVENLYERFTKPSLRKSDMPR